MQVVMNKCFFRNPEKNLAQIVILQKNAKIPKNDITNSKARLLCTLN